MIITIIITIQAHTLITDNTHTTDNTFFSSFSTSSPISELENKNVLLMSFFFSIKVILILNPGIQKVSANSHVEDGFWSTTKNIFWILAIRVCGGVLCWIVLGWMDYELWSQGFWILNLVRCGFWRFISQGFWILFNEDSVDSEAKDSEFWIPEPKVDSEVPVILNFQKPGILDFRFRISPSEFMNLLIFRF